MIKQLTVKNWKSFEEAAFYVDPLTILIGANASGKSNLLDAFLFLQRISANVGISQAISGDVNLTPLRGGLEWICRKPENSFTIEAVIEASEKQDYLYTISCIVNDVKAEVFHESLCVLTYSGKNKTPREKYLFKTAQEEASTPGVPTYFYTGTQGRGKRIDLNRTHCILSQADALNFGGRRMKKVLIFDTSILCVWLDVPGMDSCGSNQDKWDKARVQQKIEETCRSMAGSCSRKIVHR